MKQFVHIKNFDTFSSKHLSADINNTTYTVGMNSTVYNGTPDISYTSIVFIQDTKQVWTHGTLYNCYSEVGKTIDVTYLVLKALIAESKLIPGQQYRIIDYETIVNDASDDISVTHHPFDIIVVALTNNTLAEEARAIHSARDNDMYFRDSNLEAWKIWYCFDNDTNRFSWANEDYGKGVIYRMIDEWNNDCPYDFKNIMFYRYLDDQGNIINDTSFTKCLLYTFSYATKNNSNIIDTTISGNNGSLVDSDDVAIGVYNNTINKCIDDNGANGYPTQCLNKIIFCAHYDYNEGEDWFDGCYGNTLGANCSNIAFGGDCSNNTFGGNCFNDILGTGCSHNTLGTGCSHNTLGIHCNNNTFDNYCTYNTLGASCYGNTLGASCSHNTLGTGCSHNTFGCNCFNNTLGIHCDYNTFGNYCRFNYIPEYSKSIRFNNSCEKLHITTTSRGYSDYVQNITVLSGNYNNKNIQIDTFNQQYETKIGLKPNGELRYYCETDLWVNL